MRNTLIATQFSVPLSGYFRNRTSSAESDAPAAGESGRSSRLLGVLTKYLLDMQPSSKNHQQLRGNRSSPWPIEVLLRCVHSGLLALVVLTCLCRHSEPGLEAPPQQNLVPRNDLAMHSR